MCGIAGVIAADPALPIDEGPLWEAAKLLHHRGPDGTNVWAEPGVGLFHTRLAIIDQAHGDQPMFSQDGRYVVVFNGEIYNHHELRRDLEGHGYRLRTRCDTEVLLYLYDRLGDAMVERLRGMFALVVFDRRERRALLARDRFGKKPLYFDEAGGVLRFASTLDALRSLLPVSPDLDVAAIAQYLVLQYVPSPLTPYRGVNKLSPGHLATWSEGAMSVRRYWEPPQRSPDARPVDRREAALRVRELIGQAVRIRLEGEAGGARTVRGDAHRLPFRSGAFDVVVSSDSLEHFTDPADAVDEARWVLRPEGSFVVWVPFMHPFHGNDYYRYTPIGLRLLLERAAAWLDARFARLQGPQASFAAANLVVARPSATSASARESEPRG